MSNINILHMHVCSKMRMTTYPVLAEGKIRQQIHILEYPAEVAQKFPKSKANTLSPSECTIQTITKI